MSEAAVEPAKGGAAPLPQSEIQDLSEAGGPFLHVDSARGVSHRFDDHGILGGTAYRYRIVAYDLAGNRSLPRGPVAITPEATHA